MSCPLMAAGEPIADIVVDKTTKLYPNHTIYTHLGCVLLRTCIGLVLINSNLGHAHPTYFIYMFIAVLLMFSVKYVTTNNVWKFYPRPLIAYASALVSVSMGHPVQAGMLVVVDALMGLQSRHSAHTATVISKC